MASVEKFKPKEVPRLLAHCNRTQKNQGKHIDQSRTHLNFNLAEGEHPEQTDYQYAKARINRDDVRMLKREDVNSLCSWVITYPKELCHEARPDGLEDGYYTPNDSKECREFFQAAYDFFKERHGEDNVVSSYVHMDENMPHMHFTFTPIVHDKDDRMKVSAKEALEGCYGAKFQVELQDYISERMGKELHMVRQETVDYERNVRELKKKTLNEKCAELARQIRISEEQLERKKAAINAVTKAIEAGEVDVKVSSSNGYTVMKNSDWNYIQQQLKAVRAMKAERKELQKELEKLDKTNLAKENEQLKAELNGLKKESEKSERASVELNSVLTFMQETEIEPGVTIMDKYMEETEVNRESR